MLSLLKPQNLHQFFYEGGEAPLEEHQNEAKDTILIRKNISSKVYYLARNLTCLYDI